jgi:hypothetical protein
VEDPVVGLTVAVKSTDPPNTDGFGAEVRTVLVETTEEVTTCVTMLEVLPEKLVEATVPGPSKVLQGPVADVQE